MLYADPLTTRENIMQRIIINNCRNIPKHVLLSTVQNFVQRIQLCINNNGGISNIL